MRYKSRKMIIGSLLLMSILLMASNSIAVPGIRFPIQLAPETPKPQDEVTFTAQIDDYLDYVKGVYLIVDEYQDGTPLEDGFNESMEDKGGGTFELKLQLKYDIATSFNYQFAVNVQNHPTIEWNLSDAVQVMLDLSGSEDTNGDTNGGTDDTDDTSGGTSQTPGFELLFLIVAIGIVFYFKKKRR